MQPWQQLGAAIGVGLLFGITNPLSRIGGVQASRRSQRSAGFTGTVAAYLSTPLFAVSQVIHCMFGLVMDHKLEREPSMPDGGCTKQVYA